MRITTLIVSTSSFCKGFFGNTFGHDGRFHAVSVTTTPTQRKLEGRFPG